MMATISAAKITVPIAQILVCSRMAPSILSVALIVSARRITGQTVVDRGDRLGWRSLSACVSPDPAKLISTYRKFLGLGVDNQLPRGASFTAMIEAILDHVERTRQSEDTGDK